LINMLPKLVSTRARFQRIFTGYGLYLFVLPVAVSALLQSVSAQTSVSKPTSQSNQQALAVTQDIPQSSGAYQLGPNDVIRVAVLKQDLLTQDGVRIGNDGKIRLPMLDEPVQAACLTDAELAASLTEKYRRFILNPQVYVSVREFNARSVAVIGAVNSPGRFQLQRPVRLLEMMTFVNGPAPTAGRELQILRSQGAFSCEPGNVAPAGAAIVAEGEPEILSLDLNAVLNGSADSNPYLKGGDIIRVVEAELREAFIVGNVARGYAVNLKDPVTLSMAIAMAGGPLSGSRLDKVKITRQAPGSVTKRDIFVNLKEIRDGIQDDVLLEANDIVDVPGPSATKKFFKDLIRTIVPVFTRVPVIIP
jgi:polysaccharide biosynthesis/export protein